MKQFYTYLHCKPNGDPFYVGKGSGKRSHNLRDRTEWHLRCLAKYGSAMRIFVFPCDSEQQAFADEIQHIAHLRREGYALVNLTDGGDGTSGMVYTVESRLKMSVAAKGKIISASTRAKMSAVRTGKKKPPFSAEHKEKLRAANLGKRYSEEVRAKVSAANTGRKHSAATIAKMCAAQQSLAKFKSPKELERLRTMNIGRKQKPRTETHCAAISAALTGKKRAPFSETARANMSAAKLGNKNSAGRRLSPEHIEAIRRANMGNTHTKGRKLARTGKTSQAKQINPNKFLPA